MSNEPECSCEVTRIYWAPDHLAREERVDSLDCWLHHPRRAERRAQATAALEEVLPAVEWVTRRQLETEGQDDGR